MFQDVEGQINWKAHFKSSPETVYQSLTDPTKRKQYWADEAEEDGEKVTFVFKNLNFVNVGKIIERVPNRSFKVVYLDTTVTFELEPDLVGGTDLALKVENVKDGDKVELIAGWVNWLMTMRAAVDYGIDLRNHDPKRTWREGYVEN